MKKTFATLALATMGLTSMTASAFYDGPVYTRINSWTRSCSAVQRTIARAGAVIVYEGPDIYDKCVAHQGYCALGERAELTWIATADTSRCPVYQCRSDSHND